MALLDLSVTSVMIPRIHLISCRRIEACFWRESSTWSCCDYNCCENCNLGSVPASVVGCEPAGLVAEGASLTVISSVTWIVGAAGVAKGTSSRSRVERTHCHLRPIGPLHTHLFLLDSGI